MAKLLNYKNKKWPMQLLHQLLLLRLLQLLPMVLPLPQNLFDQVQLGAMTVAGNMADMLQNGAAVNKDIGFETPIFSAHSKGAIGFGDAMRPRNNDDSDDSDSYERRRRRRRRQVPSSISQEQKVLELFGNFEKAHMLQHRNKRSPCGGTGGGVGGGGGGTGGNNAGDGGAADYDDEQLEERRKRRRRQRARKRAARRQRRQSKKSRKRKTNLNLNQMEEVLHALHRQRRQAVEEMQNDSKSFGQQIAENSRKITERVRSAWDSFMNKMSEVVQTVKQSIGSVAGGNANSTGAGS